MGAFLSWTLIVLWVVCIVLAGVFVWTGESELVAVVFVPLVVEWMISLPKDEAWERWGWG